MPNAKWAEVHMDLFCVIGSFGWAYTIMNCPSCGILHCRCHCHCLLWTVLLSTCLIIETSYHACICKNAPSICTWNIWSMWHTFLKWQPFCFFFLYFASPSNMDRLSAFIIGTVMHLFWGYIHRRNYVSVANILKVMNFF